MAFSFFVVVVVCFYGIVASLNFSQQTHRQRRTEPDLTPVNVAAAAVGNV